MKNNFKNRTIGGFLKILEICIKNFLQNFQGSKNNCRVSQNIRNYPSNYRVFQKYFKIKVPINFVEFIGFLLKTIVGNNFLLMKRINQQNLYGFQKRRKNDATVLQKNFHISIKANFPMYFLLYHSVRVKNNLYFYFPTKKIFFIIL